MADSTALREPEMSGADAQRPGAPRQPVPARGWWGVSAWLGLGLAFALWLGSLPLVDPARIDGWGLLPALPLIWYVALVLTVVVYVVELRRTEPRQLLLIAAQVVLVALLFGTTAFTYAVPRYPWTYKHIGVTEAIAAHGIDRDLDIYNNYPGFFLVAAGLSWLLHVSVQTLAQYAEVVFALLGSAAVWWAAGGLTRRPAARWATLLLFTLGNWIGQTYFAPQSLAFVLSVVVLGGVVRAAGGAASRGGWPWGGWQGTTVILAVYAAVAVTHPLTPVLVLVQVGSLWALRRGVRWWLVAGMVAIEAGWTALAWSYLSTHTKLLHFNAFDNLRPPSAGLRPALPGAAVVETAGPALMFTVGLLAVAALVLAWRQGRLRAVLIPAALAISPVIVVVAQAYGQEGMLRIYLLALPWASYLIATELLGFGADRVPEPDRFSRLRPALAYGVVALVAVLGVAGTFALELVNHVAPSDVAIARWFEEHAPPGSGLVVLDQGSPTRVTANYPEFIRGDHIATVTLSDSPELRVAVGNPRSLEDLVVNECATATDGKPVYLLTGATPAAYARLYGLISADQYRGLLRRLAADPDVRALFHDGASTVWQCSP